MNNTLYFIFTGIYTLISLSLPAQSLLNTKVPGIQVKTLDGTTVNTSRFSNSGKPFILDFWATWCKPCVAEMDAIEEDIDDWKKETGVKVIAVSVDDTRTMSKVSPFVKEKGWDYEFYLDPNQDFQHAMQVINVPCTFIIDGEGKIAFVHNSYMEGDSKKLHEALRKIAASK